MSADFPVDPTVALAIAGGTIATFVAAAVAFGVWRKNKQKELRQKVLGDAAVFIVYHRKNKKQLLLAGDEVDALTFVPRRVKEAAAQWDNLGKLRKTAFDEDNDDHVALLKRLWAVAFGDVPFERTSEKWTDLGFQQSDPTTDLRGGGIISLEHFVLFAEHHTASFQAMVMFNKMRHREGSHSWFLPAVVSIQFTAQLMMNEYTPYGEHVAFVLSEDEEPVDEDDEVVRTGVMKLQHRLLLHFFSVWKDRNPHVMEFTQFVGPNVIQTFFTKYWKRPVAAIAPKVERMGFEGKKQQ